MYDQYELNTRFLMVDGPAETVPNLRKTVNGWWSNEHEAFGRGVEGLKKAADWYDQYVSSLMSRVWRIDTNVGTNMSQDILGRNHNIESIMWFWGGLRRKDLSYYCWRDPVTGWESLSIETSPSTSTSQRPINSEWRIAERSTFDRSPNKSNRKIQINTTITMEQLESIVQKPERLNGIISPTRNAGWWPTYTEPPAIFFAEHSFTRSVLDHTADLDHFFLCNESFLAAIGSELMDDAQNSMLTFLVKKMSSHPEQTISMDTVSKNYSEQRVIGFTVLLSTENHIHTIHIDSQKGKVKVICGYEEDDHKYADWLKREAHGFMQSMAENNIKWSDVDLDDL